jgi:RimJ/RimL family protein N-acetyltransferase
MCDKNQKTSNQYLEIFENLSKKYTLKIIDDMKMFPKRFNNSPIMKEYVVSHFKECLSNGGYVLLVYDEENLVFRGCVQKGFYKSKILGRCYLAIPSNAYYIEYYETHPLYRGKNIYPWVLYEICRKLHDRDIYIATDLENVPSQKGIEKCGFVRKEIVVVLNFYFSLRYYIR